MRKMVRNLGLISIVMGLTMVNTAQATLYDRGNRLIYDDHLNVTWMQYVNTAVDTGYCGDILPNCTSGLMTKEEADGFVTWFNTFYNPRWGENWRLPITPTAPDSSCSRLNNEGFNCTQSELGHLYYLELGNSAGDGGFTNRGPFHDIQTMMNYWTDWDFVSPGATSMSMTFKFRTGLQTRSDHTEKHYVWLVHDGDVAPQTECNDGIDNDGDGNIDLDDAGCQNAGDDDESSDIALPYRHLQIEFIPANLAILDLVRGGYPWCPPYDPKCPGYLLSFPDPNPKPPPYMSEISKALWKLRHSSAAPKSIVSATNQLQKVLHGIPLGTYYNKEIKARVLRLIDDVRKQQTLASSSEFLTSGLFIKSLNAIELDWRVPKLKAHKVKNVKHVSVDFNGMVWAGLREVVKPGELRLNIHSKYEAFPLNSEFSASWPFLSYEIDFDGKLGSKGFLDLRFYIKPLRFRVKASEIRVLRIDKEGLVDVTAGRDLSRGIVRARSDRPGTFIVVGKDKKRRSDRGK